MTLEDVRQLIPSLLQCKAVERNLESLLERTRAVVKESQAIIDKAAATYSDSIRVLDSKLASAIERQYLIAEDAKETLFKTRGSWTDKPRDKVRPPGDWHFYWEMDKATNDGAVKHVAGLWREYKRLADEWERKYPAPQFFHWNGTRLQGPVAEVSVSCELPGERSGVS